MDTLATINNLKLLLQAYDKQEDTFQRARTTLMQIKKRKRIIKEQSGVVEDPDYYESLRDHYKDLIVSSARLLAVAAQTSNTLSAELDIPKQTFSRSTRNAINTLTGIPVSRSSLESEEDFFASQAADDMYLYCVNAHSCSDLWTVKGRISDGQLVAALVDEHSEPNLWILASVVNFIAGRDRYTVIDEDIGESTQKRKTYMLPAEKLIRIPSLKEYPAGKRTIFDIGTSVLGIYPGSTVFYSATIKKTPKRSNSDKYTLQFTDDDGKQVDVDPLYVVPLPARYL